MAKRKNHLKTLADDIRLGREWEKNIDLPDSVHVSDLKVANKKSFADWLSAGKKTAVLGLESAILFTRKTDVALLWMAEYLVRIFNTVFINNQAMRWMDGYFDDIKLDKEKQNSKWYKFKKNIKNHPVLTSYLVYYTAFVMLMSGAGYGINLALDGKDVQNKKELLDNDDDKIDIKQGTFAAYLDKMRPLTPLLIADLIAKEGIRLDENGLHKPYLDSRGVWTIGFGSTVLKDGTRVTPDSPHITDEQAYELARYHIEEKETFFIMYCYDVACKDLDVITTNQALGLGSVFYNSYSKLVENKDNKNHKNRFEELRNLYKTYGLALPDSLVQDVFNKYPITDMQSFGKAWIDKQSTDDMADKLGEFCAGGNGVRWRRWLEAGLLTGDINAQMLLDCPANGMYEFYCYMGKDKEAFFTGKVGNRKVNKDTYAIFKEWIKNPVNKQGISLKGWKKNSDYMPDDIVRVCKSNKCVLGGEAYALIPKTEQEKERQQKIEIQTFVLGYEQAYADALDDYKNKNYKSAEKKYLDLIEKHPDNALLRNDLAATYNNLGMYEQAIEQVREIVWRIGDRSQYGAAQYNAGVAYEKQGDLQKALVNYRLALANGNKNAKAAINRVSENIKRGVNKKISYNNATQNLKTKISKKKLIRYDDLVDVIHV